jgi:hypothetical protein
MLTVIAQLNQENFFGIINTINSSYTTAMLTKHDPHPASRIARQKKPGITEQQKPTSDEKKNLDPERPTQIKTSLIS